MESEGVDWVWVVALRTLSMYVLLPRPLMVTLEMSYHQLRSACFSRLKGGRDRTNVHLEVRV